MSKNWRKRTYRKYRRMPKLARQIIKSIVFVVLATIADFLLLYILTVLTAANLIDWKVVVSFLVVEMLAAVFAKLFRIGGPSETEEKNQKIALSISRAQFSHLLVLSLENEGYNTDYPNSHYRVVNTKTRICYWMPTYLEPLVEEENVLNEIKLDNEEKLERYLKENKLRDANEFPDSSELGAQNRKCYKRKHAYKIYIGEQ